MGAELKFPNPFGGELGLVTSRGIANGVKPKRSLSWTTIGTLRSPGVAMSHCKASSNLAEVLMQICLQDGYEGTNVDWLRREQRA